MTHYTIRDAATGRPVATTDTLAAAVTQLETERLAFLLHPPDTPGDLDLIVTADGPHTGGAGQLLIVYAAGRTPASPDW